RSSPVRLPAAADVTPATRRPRGEPHRGGPRPRPRARRSTVPAVDRAHGDTGGSRARKGTVGHAHGTGDEAAHVQVCPDAVSDRDLRPATYAVVAGRPERTEGARVNPPVVLSSPYVGRGAAAPGVPVYTRLGTETWEP